MTSQSREEIEEKAAAARDVLGSSIFKEAFENLRAAYIQQLVLEPVGSLTASTAHASIKVLEDVKNELQIFINNATVASKRR